MGTKDRIVLDASAVLALLNSEPGKDIVEKLLPNSMMSVVNAAEVIAELDTKLSISPADGHKMLVSIIHELAPFNLEQATEAAALKRLTQHIGLSLGDRACLSLAKINNLTVYTADKIWSKLDVGINIKLIR